MVAQLRADDGSMAAKREKPTPTTVDLTDLIARDILAEAAAGVTVERLRARLLDDGQGPTDGYGGARYDRELQIDIVLHALNDEDISDRRLSLTIFDAEDLLFDVAIDIDQPGGNVWEDRAASRGGRSLHSKYRRSYSSSDMPDLGRMEFSVRLPTPATDDEPYSVGSWEPERSELQVQITVDPRLAAECTLSQAVVRSGYNDGYVVSIHGSIDSSTRARMDELSRLLTLGPTLPAMQLRGALYDGLDNLVDTFMAQIQPNGPWPTPLHLWHTVGLDIPLATRARLIVQLDA